MQKKVDVSDASLTPSKVGRKSSTESKAEEIQNGW